MKYSVVRFFSCAFFLLPFLRICELFGGGFVVILQGFSILSAYDWLLEHNRGKIWPCAWRYEDVHGTSRTCRGRKELPPYRKRRVQRQFLYNQEGILRAYVPANDSEQTLWFGYPGQAVIDVWCYNNGALSPIFIEAVTPCELLCIKVSAWSSPVPLRSPWTSGAAPRAPPPQSLAA